MSLPKFKLSETVFLATALLGAFTGCREPKQKAELEKKAWELYQAAAATPLNESKTVRIALPEAVDSVVICQGYAPGDQIDAWLHHMDLPSSTLGEIEFSCRFQDGFYLFLLRGGRIVADTRLPPDLATDDPIVGTPVHGILECEVERINRGWEPRLFIQAIRDGSSGDRTERQEPAFTVRAEKHEYRVGEPIFLEGKLENAGKIPLLVNNQFFVKSQGVMPEGCGVALKIVTSDARELQPFWLYEMEGPGSHWFIRLAPGESNAARLGGDLAFWCKDPGTYRIKAYYYNFLGERFRLEPWMGVIRSNTTEIRVTQ